MTSYIRTLLLVSHRVGRFRLGLQLFLDLDLDLVELVSMKDAWRVVLLLVGNLS